MIPKFRPLDDQAKQFIAAYVSKHAPPAQIKDMTMGFKCGYLAGCGHMFETMDATDSSDKVESDIVSQLENIRADVMKFSMEVLSELEAAKSNKKSKDSQPDPTKHKHINN